MAYNWLLPCAQLRGPKPGDNDGEGHGIPILGSCLNQLVQVFLLALSIRNSAARWDWVYKAQHPLPSQFSLSYSLNSYPVYIYPLIIYRAHSSGTGLPPLSNLFFFVWRRLCVRLTPFQYPQFFFISITAMQIQALMFFVLSATALSRSVAPYTRSLNARADLDIKSHSPRLASRSITVSILRLTLTNLIQKIILEYLLLFLETRRSSNTCGSFRT